MAGFTVQRPERGLEVVQAIPGRVRVRACGNGLELVLEKIAQSLSDREGCQTYVNQKTRSLLITFDENKLLLEQVLEQLRQSGVATPVKVAQTPAQIGTWSPVETRPVASLLEAAQLDSFVSLMVGMSIAQQLGIYGLPAIPVYLIAANTTRQVIDQLKLELPLLQTLVGVLEPPQISEKASSTEQSALYQIVHAVPGRVRFQVTRLASDPAYSRRLERLIESVPEITRVRINSAAASLVVTYKKGAVSEQAMRSRLIDLIQQASVAAAPKVSTQLPGSQANNAVALPSEWNAHRLLAERDDAATEISEKVSVAVAKNGHRPLSEMQTAALESVVKQIADPVAAKMRAIAPLPTQTPANLSPKKTTMWSEYKPPALSMFLAFMANLY